MFLLVGMSLIFSGSVTIFHWIVLDLGMLFQSVKSLALRYASIHILDLVSCKTDWCMSFFICSIANSFQISFPFGSLPSSSRAIASPCRCCRRSDGAIEIVSLNVLRVIETWLSSYIKVVILVSYAWGIFDLISRNLSCRDILILNWDLTIYQ